MTLKNNKQQGFTLVELLIVIVVIAILAAITIVAYNGVQNRAKSTTAQSAAQNVTKKAELYNTEESHYPSALTDLTGASSDKTYALTGVTLGTPSSSADATTVSFTACGDTGTSTAPDATHPIVNYDGDKVGWYDYANKQVKYETAGVTSGTTGSSNYPIACV